MTYYFIYKTTNIVNQKIYIGMHRANILNDAYLGSGKLLLRAIKKYGKENFKREILFTFSNERDMVEKEMELVTEEFCRRNDTYNVMPGGNWGSKDRNNLSFEGRSHSNETKTHLRNISLGTKRSEDVRKRLSDSSWAKREPNAQKEHARRAGSYAKSDVHKERISLALRGRRGSSINLGVKKKTVECPKCHKHIAKHVANRWHFDNCKIGE